MHPKIILETELKFDKMIFQQEQEKEEVEEKKETVKKEGKEAD